MPVGDEAFIWYQNGWIPSIIMAIEETTYVVKINSIDRLIIVRKSDVYFDWSPDEDSDWDAY